MNYYELLEISESASPTEIKSAFKRLALKFHPDKHKGEAAMEDRFKEINEAYQVLSNPYEKARYDIKLKYGSTLNTNTSYSDPVYTPPPPPRYRYRRPRYTEPEIDWQENWKATAYAFGFTFILACIVMAGISIKTYLDEKAFQERLAERRATFNQARTEYKMGNVAPALEKINQLGVFLEVEKDMETYKQSLFESFIYKGTHNFNLGDYQKSIYFFELIELYYDKHPKAIRERLAESYRFTKQPYKALKIYTEILLTGQKDLDIYVHMAEIYRNQLNDPKESKRYYELASQQAIKKYEAIYGKAYPFVLNGSILPAIHYDLYTGLASIYLENGFPERAIKATVWNINVWPDSARNYYIAAKSYDVIGNTDLACENYHIARLLGSNESIPFICQ